MNSVSESLYHGVPVVVIPQMGEQEIVGRRVEELGAGLCLARGEAGPLSVELFLPRFQQGDPFEVAKEIRQKAESVMRQPRVI